MSLRTSTRTVLLEQCENMITVKEVVGGEMERMSTDNPFAKSGCEGKARGWKKDGAKEVCYSIGRIWDNINAAKKLSIDRKIWK